ncbi:hypothetical protein AS156_18085 [Bradyrhizobium macuxiense]|uniref:Uncharacterized protein n=1 Tax=Bradyrhizobium macuxiense TaxID=1755647 RepID=A0A109JG91_9BRAD|nr:hypothetical protein AS156_18085 [Bradyrhizobium macuxiense]
MIHPTLSWLDDIGYMALDSEVATRKPMLIKSWRMSGPDQEDRASLAVNRFATPLITGLFLVSAHHAPMIFRSWHELIGTAEAMAIAMLIASLALICTLLR